MGRTISTPVAAHKLTEIHSVEITMQVQNPYAMHRSAGMVKVMAWVGTSLNEG